MILEPRNTSWQRTSSFGVRIFILLEVEKTVKKSGNRHDGYLPRAGETTYVILHEFWALKRFGFTLAMLP